MPTEVYLIKVDASENNNKFYKMVPHGDSFTVEYGRVGLTSTSRSYPIGQWSKKYREKLRKGYVDQTEVHMVAKSESKKFKDLSDPSLQRVIDKLMLYANEAIKQNYTVSASVVTQKMIDEAQYILNQLSRVNDKRTFNRDLQRLFTVIPRKMKRVSDFLVYDISSEERTETLQREQDLLDVMKGQIVTADTTDYNDKAETVLDALGLRIAKTTPSDVRKIKGLMQNALSYYKDSWILRNLKTEKAFDDFVQEHGIDDVRSFWHGSKNENWWNIVISGLLINPPATTTGKMFGYGIYFAQSARKSLGYTSIDGSYWARGREQSAFMSLYRVAYGKPYFTYVSERGMNWNNLKRQDPNATCLHAKEGRSLRNDEVVVYNQEQTTIEYLVELQSQ